MISISENGSVSGMTSAQRAEMDKDFAEYDIIRRIERWSIREFMCENASHLTGNVLDYGAGEKPYKYLVRGTYMAWRPNAKMGSVDEDLMQDPAACGSATFDAIMCNQVLQYVPSPQDTLALFNRLLKRDKPLVLTFATNWDEVEESDMWRFTMSGMSTMLSRAGFTDIRHTRRAQVTHDLFKFPLGYGVVAR